MTMEKKGKDDEKCILVGVQLNGNGNGRDLLHWTLSKVAREGDRVVAVHVCRDSDLCNTSTLSLIKVLDDYIAACEVLCSSKQVVLVGRVSRGNSIRKVIVEEAKLCAAMTVVVGVNNKYSLRCSDSLAKYCAKNLPPSTALFAVSNGTVVFERSADKLPPENVIGKGGNSQVYKGRLSDGQEAAIKLSKLSAKASSDFLLEADIITSIQHEYIVPMIGVCVEDRNLITVYKYFSKGSLGENLHDESPLPWDMRFNVAIGVAEALNYLHNDYPRPVIHRDVKSSNILLSDEFEPQLSDFGLAIWAPTTSSYLTHNDVVGTFGYLAPEYFMYGKVSDKIDIYAFGVLLLELLTGRKPISNDNPNCQESLLMWASPILETGNVTELLDPYLKAMYNDDQMQRMILAASLCITRVAHLRPPMNQILSLLKGEEEVHTWISSHKNNTPTDLDCQDDETYQVSSFRSHLGLALLDVDDDALLTNFEQNHMSSWEEYLKGRWSCSSSFN